MGPRRLLAHHLHLVAGAQGRALGEAVEHQEPLEPVVLERHLRSRGAAPRVSFECARHLWRDKLAEVGPPLDLTRYMGGWTGSNVSEHYAGAPSP